MLAKIIIAYEIIGACSSTPARLGTFDIQNVNDSVGKTSIDIFKEENIPYIGTEDGFNSILNSPTDLDSIEVISDTKLRAYGWCYSVNGIEPDVLPSNYFFTQNENKLVWYYAYSTYDNGQWLDYCVPSYKVKAAQFCNK